VIGTKQNLKEMETKNEKPCVMNIPTQKQTTNLWKRQHLAITVLNPHPGTQGSCVTSNEPKRHPIPTNWEIGRVRERIREM
jgi:hypothetical protein